MANAIKLLILMFIFVNIGCASLGERSSLEKDSLIEEDWIQASNRHDIAGYKNFLIEYPISKYSNEAKSRIEQIRWEKAIDDNSAQAFSDFLHEHPHSQHSNEAKSRLEPIRWEKAINANSAQLKFDSCVFEIAVNPHKKIVSA